jgi:DNA-binding ferritin-like protein (Dps family)
MKLKTNIPLDVLQAYIKRYIELGKNYITLYKTIELYSWFIGAKALKNIKIGTSEKEEVFYIPAT